MSRLHRTPVHASMLRAVWEERIAWDYEVGPPCNGGGFRWANGLRLQPGNERGRGPARRVGAGARMTRHERAALSVLACLAGAWLLARLAFSVGWRAFAAVLVAAERRRNLHQGGGAR